MVSRCDDRSWTRTTARCAGVPYEMVKYKFNLRLLKLGQDAASGGEGEGKDKHLESLSLRFFSFIPRLEDRGHRPPRSASTVGFRTDKAKAEDQRTRSPGSRLEIDSGNNADVKAMLLTAQIHEGKGNLRAAYAIYDYIAENYKQAKIQIDKKVVVLPRRTPSTTPRAPRSAWAT